MSRGSAGDDATPAASSTTTTTTARPAATGKPDKGKRPMEYVDEPPVLAPSYDVSDDDDDKDEVNHGISLDDLYIPMTDGSGHQKPDMGEIKQQELLITMFQLGKIESKVPRSELADNVEWITGMKRIGELLNEYEFPANFMNQVNNFIMENPAREALVAYLSTLEREAQDRLDACAAYERGSEQEKADAENFEKYLKNLKQLFALDEASRAVLDNNYRRFIADPERQALAEIETEDDDDAPVWPQKPDFSNLPQRAPRTTPHKTGSLANPIDANTFWPIDDELLRRRYEDDDDDFLSGTRFDDLQDDDDNEIPLWAREQFDLTGDAGDDVPSYDVEWGRSDADADAELAKLIEAERQELGGGRDGKRSTPAYTESDLFSLNESDRRIRDRWTLGGGPVRRPPAPPVPSEVPKFSFPDLQQYFLPPTSKSSSLASRLGLPTINRSSNQASSINRRPAMPRMPHMPRIPEVPFRIKEPKQPAPAATTTTTTKKPDSDEIQERIRAMNEELMRHLPPGETRESKKNKPSSDSK